MILGRGPREPGRSLFRRKPFGRLAHGRYGHAAVALGDGRVLVAGGVRTTGVHMASERGEPPWPAAVTEPVRSAEVFDPITRRTTELSLPDGLRPAMLELVRLGAGAAAAVDVTFAAAVFQPDRAAWTEIEPYAGRLHLSALASRPDGTVVAAGWRERRGGRGEGLVAALDPAAPRWRFLPFGWPSDDASPDWFAALPDGRLLWVDPSGAAFTRALGAGAAWTPLPRCPWHVVVGRSFALPGGRLALLGLASRSDDPATVATIFDAGSGGWHRLRADLPPSRITAATQLPTGDVIAVHEAWAGGSVFSRLDAAGERWTLAAGPRAPTQGAAVVAAAGGLLVLGGQDEGLRETDAIWRLDAATAEILDAGRPRLNTLGST